LAGNLLVPRVVGGMDTCFGRRHDEVFELSVTRPGLGPRRWVAGKRVQDHASAPGWRIGGRSLGSGEATPPSPAPGTPNNRLGACNQSATRAGTLRNSSAPAQLGSYTGSAASRADRAQDNHLAQGRRGRDGHGPGMPAPARRRPRPVVTSVGARRGPAQSGRPGLPGKCRAPPACPARWCEVAPAGQGILQPGWPVLRPLCARRGRPP
jgi:hypothetical protein